MNPDKSSLKQRGSRNSNVGWLVGPPYWSSISTFIFPSGAIIRSIFQLVQYFVLSPNPTKTMNILNIRPEMMLVFSSKHDWALLQPYRAASKLIKIAFSKI